MKTRFPEWVRGNLLPRFEALGIGETFLVPVDEQTCSWASFKVRVSTYNGRLSPKRFQSRKCEDGAFEVCRTA